jgi:hypothetical protein
MLAFKCYIVALVFGLYVLLTDAAIDKIYYDLKKTDTLAGASNDHIELLSYKLKVDYLVTILMFIIFDFYFRFRVIESLYQQYKQEEENQNRMNSYDINRTIEEKSNPFKIAAFLCLSNG